MGEEKVCSNAECLTLYTPNRRGATKAHCPRCVMWMRRHDGQLPGPKREVVPTRKHTVVLPADFEERLNRASVGDAESQLPLSTWIRLLAEDALHRLERRR